MQRTMSFNNVAVVFVKGIAYRIHFWDMSKDDAINIMNGSNLVHKMSVYKIFIIIYKKWVRVTPLNAIPLIYFIIKKKNKKNQKCDTK